METYIEEAAATNLVASDEQAIAVQLWTGALVSTQSCPHVETDVSSSTPNSRPGASVFMRTILIDYPYFTRSTRFVCQGNPQSCCSPMHYRISEMLDAQQLFMQPLAGSFLAAIAGIRSAHWLNLKNCCVPEMGLVTVYWPLITTEAEKLLVQTGDKRFVVDCRVKPE